MKYTRLLPRFTIHDLYQKYIGLFTEMNMLIFIYRQTHTHTRTHARTHTHICLRRYPEPAVFSELKFVWILLRFLAWFLHGFDMFFLKYIV